MIGETEKGLFDINNFLSKNESPNINSEIISLKIKILLDLGKINEAYEYLIHNISNEFKHQELREKIETEIKYQKEFPEEHVDIKLYMEFTSWLKQKCAIFSKIKIYQYGLNYRGVQATKHIRKG